MREAGSRKPEVRWQRLTDNLKILKIEYVFTTLTLFLSPFNANYFTISSPSSSPHSALQKAG